MKTAVSEKTVISYKPLTFTSDNPLKELTSFHWTGWNVGENRWLDHFYQAIGAGDIQRLKGLILLGLGSSASPNSMNARTPDWTFQRRVQFYMRLCYGVHDKDLFFRHNKFDERKNYYASHEVAMVAFNMLCDFYFGPYTTGNPECSERWFGRNYGAWISYLLEDEMIESVVSFFVNDEMKLQNHTYENFSKHRIPMIKGFLESLTKIIFTFSAVKYLGEEKGLSPEGIALQNRIFALQPKCLTLVSGGRWWGPLSSPESRLGEKALVELKRRTLIQQFHQVGHMKDYSDTTIRKAAANGDPGAMTLVAYNIRMMETRRLHKKAALVPVRKFL